MYPSDSVLVEPQILRDRFPYIAFAALIFVPLGLGTLAYTMTGLIIGEEPAIVETLAIKIMYSPELEKCIETDSHYTHSPETGMVTGEIGDFIRVEWSKSKGEVSIIVRNETVGTFDANTLRSEVKTLNQTLMDLPMKIAVAICRIPIFDPTKVPEHVRRDTLELLEKQSFAKWVKNEGYTYEVTGIAPIDWLTFEDPTITGVLVDMKVEDLVIKYRLFFNEPYTLANTSIPEELEVSEQERKYYGIYLVYTYEGGTSIFSYSHQESKNESSLSLWKKLDITDDLEDEILSIMKENNVLARLLEATGCEIKKITGSQYNPEVPPPPSAFSKRRATVVILCENFEGYGIKVGIDLEANIIDEVWLCEESIMATMLSNN